MGDARGAGPLAAGVWGRIAPQRTSIGHICGQSGHRSSRADLYALLSVEGARTADDPSEDVRRGSL